MIGKVKPDPKGFGYCFKGLLIISILARHTSVDEPEDPFLASMTWPFNEDFCNSATQPSDSRIPSCHERK